MSYIVDCYNKNELCEKCHSNVVRFIYIEDKSENKIKRVCATCIKDFIQENEDIIKDTK